VCSRYVLRIIADLDFLDFAPVPLRARCDGWSELQHAFVVALARGLGPGAAARSVGKNRQTAYALRKRTGAESFAAAWDAAAAFGRRARLLRSAGASPPKMRAAGPRESDKSDKSDKSDTGLSASLNFLNLRRPTVAFRPMTLRRPPC
jgi:hypothetical protein